MVPGPLVLSTDAARAGNALSLCRLSWNAASGVPEIEMIWSNVIATEVTRDRCGLPPLISTFDTFAAGGATKVESPKKYSPRVELLAATLTVYLAPGVSPNAVRVSF